MNRLRQLLPADLTRKRRIQRFALFLGLIHATFALQRKAVAPKVEKQVTSTQILIGVISCRARAQKASQVFNDWMQYAGSVSNFQAVVVVGDPFLHTEFVKHGYALQVRARDDYENLLHKVLLFFHVAHLLDFDYAVKVDDDTFVYAPQLTKQVRWKSLDYGCVQPSSSVSNMRKYYSRTWHHGKCENKFYNTYRYELDFDSRFCLGAPGYVLSRRATSLLSKFYSANFSDNCRAYEIYEDVFLGKLLRRYKIYPQRLRRSKVACTADSKRISPNGCLSVTEFNKHGLNVQSDKVMQSLQYTATQDRLFQQAAKVTTRNNRLTTESVDPSIVGPFEGCFRNTSGVMIPY